MKKQETNLSDNIKIIRDFFGLQNYWEKLKL